MLRRCLQLHLSLIVLADQTPRKAWPFRPPPGGGFGLDGDPVSEGLLLTDVSLIVAERRVQIVARQGSGLRTAALAGAPLGALASLLGAIGLALNGDDLGVVEQTVDQGDDAGGAGKGLAPFGERAAGGDDSAALLVAAIDQFEEQVGVAGGVGEVS